MDGRWRTHRAALRRSKHTSPKLQMAWEAHGAEAFQFDVIEHCARGERFEREQFHIDRLKPELNVWKTVFPLDSLPPEVLAKRIAALRARAALITHCPKGHEYNKANTHVNKKGKRICRACATDRMRAKLQRESPEQREARRRRAAVYYAANRDMLNARSCEYGKQKRREVRLRAGSEVAP